MTFSFPKIQLHLHLDGAIPAATMWHLAKKEGVQLPCETLQQWQTYIKETADCRDVNTYLARFEHPLQILQNKDNLAFVTEEVIGILAQQGHVYAEIRFAPQLHTRMALTQRDAIEAVLQGREAAIKKHPEIAIGILLCTMCIGAETVNMEQNLETVRLTKEYLGKGVVGLDLAGAEGIVPLSNFHPIFDLAKELAVPFTCHAGDSQGPDTVRDALNFGTKRIGHGHHIYDDPSLWQRAIDDQVTLEICPTSNIQCRTQPSFKEHPAKKLFDAGVRVCISTDNMALANTDLDTEYRHCIEEMGFTEEDLVQMNIYAAEAAFMDEETRKKILSKFQK
ncbi:MAG: adenosine deaminase [Oscillospiraceae bacterium]|nr:adenosine deaminase [Oscillospiraceae bacterium]